MTSPLLVSFLAGETGPWRIDRIAPVIGESLGPAPRLAVIEGDCVRGAPRSGWRLQGTTSNLRYTRRAEANALASRQEALGRLSATRAALIPIRKSAAWWALAQDERRSIMEETSRHIAIGLDYLPAIARRLHHGRELGQEFDFLTWFEFGPDEVDAFEELVGRLRATPERDYVEREVDIRLSRVGEA